MIQKIILKNFQIHKKFVFIPDEYFNIITGVNDGGKSSIIRAIFWVYYNSPSGDWMRREKNGKVFTTSVKIIYEDDVIERIKGENKNIYKLNGESYSNFGYSIPDPVQEALKVHSLKVGNAKLYPHIAMQDDHLFLVYEPNTLKASVINMLTGAEILQKAIKEFNKEKLGCTKTINILKEDIDNLKVDYKDLAYIKDAKKRLTNIFNKRKKLIKTLEKIENLQKIKQNLSKYRKTLKIQIPDISKITELQVMIEDIRERRGSLEWTKNILAENEKRVLKFSNLQCIYKVDLQKAIKESKVCSKCGRPL